MERYLSGQATLRRNPWLGHGFALLAFAAALVARFALDRSLPAGFPYLTFFPAVIITSFVAGTRAGLLCALLSGLAAWFWFIPPFGSFTVDRLSAVALGFYAFIVGVDIAIIHMLVRTAQRLETERASSARLADRHRTLFTELQHRVANNIAFVASLLALQKRRVAADPAAAPAIFEDAIQRLEAMSRLHRRIHDPAALDRPLQAYLGDLCADLVEGSGAEGVVCRVEADDVRLDLQRLTALSMIVNEVMTNSLKHAFRGRAGGTITIDLRRLPDGRCAMTLADDGPGLPADPDPSGLGTKIVRGLAAQLNGTVSTPPGPGAATRVEFSA